MPRKNKTHHHIKIFPVPKAVIGLVLLFISLAAFTLGSFSPLTGKQKVYAAGAVIYNPITGGVPAAAGCMPGDFVIEPPVTLSVNKPMQQYKCIFAPSGTVKLDSTTVLPPGGGCPTFSGVINLGAFGRFCIPSDPASSFYLVRPTVTDTGTINTQTDQQKCVASGGSWRTLSNAGATVTSCQDCPTGKVSNGIECVDDVASKQACVASGGFWRTLSNAGATVTSCQDCPTGKVSDGKVCVANAGSNTPTSTKDLNALVAPEFGTSNGECGTGATAIKTSIDLGCNKTGNGIRDLLLAAVRFLSVGVGLVLIGSIIVAGIQYVTSQGEPQKTHQAVIRILSTVIALALYLLIFALVNWLVPGGVFGAGGP